MGTKTLLIGALAGVATGIVLGILYAPDKGSNTRRRFSKKSYNYSDELEDKFNELIDSITEQFQAVVEEVNRMSEEGKHNSTKTES